MARVHGGMLAAVTFALCGSVSSGCVLSTAVLVSPKQRSEVIEVEHVAEVRSIPAGATARVGDGAPVSTPDEIRVPYKVRRTGTTYRVWPVVGAMAISAGLGAAFLFRAVDDGELLGGDAILAYGAFTDMLSGAVYIARFRHRNHLWRERASVRPIPTTVQVQVDWEGWEPATADLAVPAQGYLTVRRPTLGTFDEALFRWERHGREPTAAGLYRLGEAYDRRAQRTGDAAAKARALHYYERYLASDATTPELVTRTRARVNALRADAGGAR